MSPFDPAGIFRDAPLRARLHVALRWRLFPFPALLPYVPEGSTVLDLGCGHGLFPFYLAVCRPGVRVLGVDPDEDKVALCQRIARARGLANLDFAVVRAEDAALPPCDVLSIIDVLYLIPAAAQEALLERAARSLRPGGRLLIKEMSERPRWKATWNRAQETLSVRVLRVTQGRRFHFRRQAEWEALLRGLGLQVEARRLDAGYLHPHLLLVGTRP